MIKMIIVDDSLAELQGLTELINWNSIGIEIVNTYSSGLDAIEFIKNSPPDILLTDLRMPIIDGIELSKRVRGLNSDIKIVFISAYEDFEYAKEAIHYQVVDYISKPVRMSNLKNIMSNIVESINIEKQNIENDRRIREQLKRSLPILKEKLLHSLLFGTNEPIDNILENLDFLEVNLSDDMQYIVFMVTVDENNNGSSTAQNYADNLQIVDRLNGVEDAFFKGQTVLLSTGKFAYIAQFDKNKSELEIRKNVERFALNLISNTFTASRVFIGRVVNSLTDVEISFSDTQRIFDYQLSLNDDSSVLFYDINMLEGESDYDFNSKLINQIENKINTAILVGNTQEIENQLDIFFDYIIKVHNTNNVTIQSLCVYIIYTGIRALMERRIDLTKNLMYENAIRDIMKLTKVEDLKTKMLDILFMYAEEVKMRIVSSNPVVVEKMVEYVEKNYSKNITLNKIADHIDMTPNYIGAIFKNATGENFMDYLTKFRMEKAKMMLQNEDYLIYEVAYKVGYGNIAYFSTKFKAYHGVTPNKFKNNIKKQIENQNNDKKN